MYFYFTVLPFRKHFFIELLQFIVDVPKPPGLRLIETDATSAKLELKDAATEASNIVQPLLWCSIFHRAKFGQPQETLLPARNLNSLTIKGLKCGTTYRSEKPLSSFLMNFWWKYSFKHCVIIPENSNVVKWDFLKMIYDFFFSFAVSMEHVPMRRV